MGLQNRVENGREFCQIITLSPPGFSLYNCKGTSDFKNVSVSVYYLFQLFVSRLLSPLVHLQIVNLYYLFF
jgi:hypothetical protein